MPQPDSKRVSCDRYDAVLFDLDGAVTDTASLHATCWKQTFDEYLKKRARHRGEAFRPFDLATDYRLYVDGKPQFDGVRDFLDSRGTQPAEGNPDDPAEVETVCGLGNRKNDLVNHVIADVGVEPYEGTVRFIHQLRRNGFKIAIVTSSQNCTAVLKAAKLDDFFEVQVDGNTIHAQYAARPLSAPPILSSTEYLPEASDQTGGRGLGHVPVGRCFPLRGEEA
jgi:beta-phosphoglucomutase-like phosphatase (HAD superfamily)